MQMKSVVGASVLALLAGRAYADEPNETLLSLKAADVRPLLVDAGLTVEEVKNDSDGFHITAAVPPERHIWFDGMNCKGDGEARSCTEFMITARWEVDTAKHAADLASRMNYNYAPVAADGKSLTLMRMDFTYGGITREHLKQTLLEVLDLRDQTEKAIWPETTKSDSPSAKH